MPIYEYDCGACGKKVTLLVGVVADSSLECTFCGSTDLKKRVSRFRRGRTEDQRIDDISDRLESMPDPESPSEIREMVKEMGKAMDDDLSDDMEELFENDMDHPELVEET